MILTAIIKTLVFLCGTGPVLLAISRSIPSEDLKAEYHFYCEEVV